ncbi:DUF2388 domain-containing protein [Pseudomonas sp. Fl4BN1]|uniref:DUF2388 domain-containing protein n=1 Tax=Pseudomonas sp. Fl4BN1 TaxID=2697651 RepID=UPI002740000D|nr:DUF2388 domain-containing protein [Pseudomonas sp. Fl4BN1]
MQADLSPGEVFCAAKGDALAFVGSAAENRGTQFEQALCACRSMDVAPEMNQMQLAQALAVLPWGLLLQHYLSAHR